MPVSADLLLYIMPFAKHRVPLFVDPLNHAMDFFSITTPQDQAMFLAQLAHESGQFRYVEELASGDAYEGRADLGNVFPGDGRRFKGRGLIQVTGRTNYSVCSQALYGDQRLIDDPTILCSSGPACLSAAWFWDSRELSKFSMDLLACTRRINGGYNGLDERRKYWGLAKKILGVDG